MTQKLEDLIKGFTSLDTETQINKIKDIRSARNIERPAAAVKRVKKARKKSNAAVTKTRGILNKLSPDEKKLLIAKLLEGKK
jgi:hypothetical protein